MDYARSSRDESYLQLRERGNGRPSQEAHHAADAPEHPAMLVRRFQLCLQAFAQVDGVALKEGRALSLVGRFITKHRANGSTLAELAVESVTIRDYRLQVQAQTAEFFGVA